jgi:hypothetical protein
VSSCPHPTSIAEMRPLRPRCPHGRLNRSSWRTCSPARDPCQVSRRGCRDAAMIDDHPRPL